MQTGIYIGGPIWAYKGWAGRFYPPKTKPSDYLKEYSKRLTAVEANTTFYAVPSLETIQNWVNDTPDTFRFCPKLPRFISHTGRLESHIDEAARFLDTMSHLGERLGPMFLQLPPRYSPANFNDLQTFLEAWQSWHPLAVEVRHMGWFEPQTFANLNGLLSAHNMARVVIDTRPIRRLQGDKILTGTVYERMLAARERKPDVPVIPDRTASFTFLRYIGHPMIDENTSYMDEWSEHISRWLHENIDVYLFCHCPDERFSPSICRKFHQAISSFTRLAALPWDETDANTLQQGRLF